MNKKNMGKDKKIYKHGTLVITKLSKFGVAMVADSAITYDGRRSFVGYQKLFPVPQINAGISIWGNLDINGTDADEWIKYFINKDVTKDIELSELAEKLREKLDETFGDNLIEENNRMGLHVAGFDRNRGPTLYTINNGDYKIMMSERGSIEVSVDSTEENIIENPPLRRFEIDTVYLDEKEQTGRKNGDFGAYDFLAEKFKTIFVELQQYNLSVPYPNNLEMTGEYLRFMINSTKEIYRLSSENRRVYGSVPPTIDYMHIGGPVTVLTISKKGINSFYTI